MKIKLDRVKGFKNERSQKLYILEENEQVLVSWLLLHILSCVLSHFSRVQVFTTPWTLAHQAPLFMGFSWQEYWSGLPCYPPGIEPVSPVSSVLQVGSLPLSHWGSASVIYNYIHLSIT